MPAVLITGGHAGLGLECATHLASAYRLDLVLAGRDPERVERAAVRLRAERGVNVTALALDVASLTSVRQAVTRLRPLLANGEVAPLQAIICNAGAQFRGPVSFSPDGYEETFATNFLGHVLLVELLLDQVADGGRFVFTASGTHDPDTMDGRMVGRAAEPDAPALARQGRDGSKLLSGGRRYATSKLCTVMHAYELDRRLRAAGRSVASIAYDPGFIPETGLARTAPRAAQRLIRTAAAKRLFLRLGVTMGSLPVSGAGLARVAVDPAFAGASGRYIQSKDGRVGEARSSQVSYDRERAAKLWNDAMGLVGLQPGGEALRP